jgi:hypothetical protein
MKAHQLRSLLTCLTLKPKKGKIGWEGTTKQLVLAGMNVKLGEMIHDD